MTCTHTLVVSVGLYLNTLWVATGTWLVFAAVLAHGLRSAVEQPDLEGLLYPGPFVDHCLQLKLRDRYWE